MFETIVALATPPAKSALALIRLSGDDCFSVVSKVFSKDLNNLKEKGIHYGFILDGEKQIDEVVLLAYVAPHSFTGENSVEIITHGSMLIVNQVIGLLLASGARMATNGEFSSRAYLNGKMDLVQAEAINDMINATTQEAKDLSMGSLLGKTSEMFKPIKEEIADLLAHIEVNIDYPEYEDIEQITREQVKDRCAKLIPQLESIIKQGENELVYKEGVKIAIVGKPNVGKSTLLNALIKEDKAIVTDIAGTTRDVVEGDFNLCGVPIHLFDTAGLRESTDVIEQIGIEKTKKAQDDADLIILLVDETGIDEESYSLIKNKKHIIVYNKADLISKKDKDKIYISAKNKDVSALINKIKEQLNIGEITIKPSFSNVRQLDLLKAIVMYLGMAATDLKKGPIPLDLISVNLMAAYNCCLDLLGQNNKNDLTDEIFSRFCVGK